MNLDNSCKRYFGVTLGVMLGMAAYYQASGLSSLLAEVLLRGAPAAVPKRPRLRPMPIDDNHARSATPILARNPFDSITGPLFPAPETEPEDVLRRSVNSDPYSDPVCEGIRVLLIADSNDPAWSFATISAAGQAPLLRRTGDLAFGRIVVAIAWDRIWLVDPNARCQLRLGDNIASPLPEAPAAAPSPAGTPPRVKRKRGVLPPEIAAKIHQVGEREFVIDRATVEEILGKQDELMSTARVAPVTDGDRVTGVRLMRIQPDSLLGSLGMKNGDELRSINGLDITTPQRALEAYARLQTADDISLSLQRGGKDSTVDIHIR